MNDPKPSERSYFRHIMSGDFGYLVTDDEGQQKIKLDRAGDNVLRPFDPAQWKPENEARPLTRLQTAQVAFEADKRLCYFIGLHQESRRDWLSMREEDRIKWSNEGPGATSDPKRRKLFSDVMRSLEGHTKPR